MLREVEAGGFVLGGNAQADDLVHEEEQNQRTHDGDGPRNGDAGGLVEQLMPVAIHSAGGDSLTEGRVNGLGGEQAGEQRTHRSACAVHTEGVEGVVVAQAALDLEDHERAEDTSKDADEQGGEGLDKP